MKSLRAAVATFAVAALFGTAVALAPTASANGWPVPSDLAVSHPTQTMLDVSWTINPPWPGNDMPTDGAVFQLSWVDQTLPYLTWTSQFDYDVSDSPVRLTGLIPGDTYKVTVVARLGGTTGVPVSVTARTTDWRPTVASASIIRRTGSTLDLAWTVGTLPAFWHGRLAFQVSWRDVVTRRAWRSAPDYTQASSPLRLTGLQAGHGYVISITPYAGDPGGLYRKGRTVEVVAATPGRRTH